MAKNLLVFFFLIPTFCLFGQIPSNNIHVDQFGYLPAAEKVAVISNPQIGYNSSDSFTPIGDFEVRLAENDEVVYAAPAGAWQNGLTHELSGDQGWWFDFSQVSTPGEYYIINPATGEQTGNFMIDITAYDSVLRAATKMFYYNRCNATKAAPFAENNWTDGMNFMNANQDANCRFVFDQGNADTEKDLTGGWFDAGDYNKYVTFAESAVHNLLSAYEENPDVFSDDFGIPESGNGIPDVLDELIWELDWLYKMSNEDGTVHIKMGSIDYGHNAAAPPSNNFDVRYYGPVCSAASLTVASMFAHAAIVLRSQAGLTDYADQLESRAIACWNHAKTLLDANQLQTDCDDGTIKSGDADRSEADQREMALTAAAYLFLATEDNSYHTYLQNNINDAEPIANGFWGPYKLTLQTALLDYVQFPESEVALASTIVNSLTTAANNNWDDYFGFSEADLYRTAMPSWSYHWGSNSPKAGYALLNRQLIESGILESNHASYALAAAEHLHFFHGVNPMGMVMLSNMYAYGAERSADEIYHTWFNDGTDWDNAQTSAYGPAPGFVVGGPNKDFSVSALAPPAGQPAMKSYLDFNDGFPNNSWEITEPAIYYQAVYLRLLANFTNLA